jgi:carbon monoxide dehydrogenase subunit G
MASLRKEIDVEAPAAAVWDAVRDFPRAHPRLFPGVLLASRAEEGGRSVRFANGLELRERLVACDEAQRRLVYAAVGGRTSHHNSSLQVLELGPRRSRVVWITDFLPDTLAGSIAGLVELGAADMKRALEAAPGAPLSGAAA